MEKVVQIKEKAYFRCHADLLAHDAQGNVKEEANAVVFDHETVPAAAFYRAKAIACMERYSNVRLIKTVTFEVVRSSMPEEEITEIPIEADNPPIE